MALETGTYISDLVATNPTATDPKSQGDDHLRLIKSTVKVTFPNISGAVLPTHTELNYVDGVTSAIQTQIDAKAPSASPTFTGTVVLPTTTSIGTVTAVEIGYVDGVTSAIQTQIDAKAPIASPTFTGIPAAPTATAGTNTTQLATTAFVTQTAFSAVLPAQPGGTITYQLTSTGGTAAWSAPNAATTVYLATNFGGF